jgi:hypothetical protein
MTSIPPPHSPEKSTNETMGPPSAAAGKGLWGSCVRAEHAKAVSDQDRLLSNLESSPFITRDWWMLTWAEAVCGGARETLHASDGFLSPSLAATESRCRLRGAAGRWVTATMSKSQQSPVFNNYCSFHWAANGPQALPRAQAPWLVGSRISAPCNSSIRIYMLGNLN